MTQRKSAGAGTETGRAGGEFPPAASAVLAAPQNTVEEAKQPLTFAEVDHIDARDRTDKPVRERMADDLNEAVGENRFIVNASMHGWYRLRGTLRFSVTRFYFHKRVAIDFPRSFQDVTIVEQKRDVLRALGIVYVAIMPGESLSPEQVQKRIRDEKLLILPASEPKADTPAAIPPSVAEPQAVAVGA